MVLYELFSAALVGEVILPVRVIRIGDDDRLQGLVLLSLIVLKLELGRRSDKLFDVEAVLEGGGEVERAMVDDIILCDLLQFRSEGQPAGFEMEP